VSSEANGQQCLYIEWLHSVENFHCNRTYNIIRLDNLSYHRDREMNSTNGSSIIISECTHAHIWRKHHRLMLTLLSFFLLLNISLVCIEFSICWESSICQCVIIIRAYTGSSSTMFMHDCLLVIIVMASLIESLLATYIRREETYNVELFICICLLDIIYLAFMPINYSSDEREQLLGFT